MFALVRQRRWLGLLALAIILSVAFWWLGLWQWHRHFTRADLNAAVDAAQAQPVAPLTQVMPDPERLAPEAEYRRASASGRYVADAQRLVRADGRAGFTVVTPLLLDSGGTLLVDRGYVPFSLTSPSSPASDVTPPDGPVTLEVRLRASQGPDDRQAQPGEIASVDPPTYPVPLEAPVYAAYGDLTDQAPPPDAALEPAPPANIGMGPHLFYALQWWSFIVIAAVGYVVLLRREARAGRSPSQDGDNAASGIPDRPPRS